MLFPTITRLFHSNIWKSVRLNHNKHCHSIFGVKDIVKSEKALDNFSIKQVTSEHHHLALEMVKEYYLTDHVLVKSKKMDLANDKAFDEYLIGLFRQGNTLFMKTDDDIIAGICVSFATSPVDTKNLRNYACYRQDPNTKDFLNFTAKLQETPNLWDLFKQQKIFEIRMLAIAPEYRRQGLAVMLVDKAKTQAHDQGYHVLRMDCINPYDYKVAERCMFQCLVKYPLHKLRGPNAPYVKRSSEYNCCVRVYVQTHSSAKVDKAFFRRSQNELESLIE